MQESFNVERLQKKLADTQDSKVSGTIQTTVPYYARLAVKPVELFDQSIRAATVHGVIKQDDPDFAVFVELLECFRMRGRCQARYTRNPKLQGNYAAISLVIFNNEGSLCR